MFFFFLPSRKSGVGKGRKGSGSEPDTTDAACESTVADRQETAEEISEREEIEAIYKEEEFLAFRQHYLDCLGPPKNFHKMRRAVPRKVVAGQQVDHRYLQRRLMNNASAKRSRDNKRQRFVENQISVMYLQYKVKELLAIKDSLLATANSAQESEP